MARVIQEFAQSGARFNRVGAACDRRFAFFDGYNIALFHRDGNVPLIDVQLYYPKLRLYGAGRRRAFVPGSP